MLLGAYTPHRFHGRVSSECEAMATAICDMCGNMGLQKGGDGFHYCSACGTQSQNFQDEDLGDFQPLGQDEAGRRIFMVAREHNVRQKAQESTLKKLQDKFRGAGTLDIEDYIDDPEAARAREEELHRILSQKPDHDEEQELVRNTLASQFSSFENVQVWSGSQQFYDDSEIMERLASHMREVYVEGLQKIIQMQCEVMVQQFGISPLICGVVGPIWLRFVASTRVFEKEWANEAILVADAEKRKNSKETPEDPDVPNEPEDDAKAEETKIASAQKRRKYKGDIVPVTKTGLKVSSVWSDALKDRIPPRITLAILYLACHVAREPVLPTDITNWARQGVLPFLVAFLKIQPKRFVGPDMKAVQVPELETKSMFRPSFMTNARMVELLAAHVANRLGLELPPVNFHAISCRLLADLELPTEKFLTSLERLYEWYTPDGLWLSARKRAFPSRAYVMSMIIVTIKLLYKVDGHAESSLYWPSVRERLRPSFDASAIGPPGNFQELLDSMEKRLLDDALKTDEDLSEYLKYCQEVIYPGLSHTADEDLVYNHLWQCFEKLSQKDSKDEGNEHGEDEQEELAPTRAPNLQQSESTEYSLGSAAWSKVASAQKPPTPVEKSKDNVSAEEEADLRGKLGPTEQEVSSAEADQQALLIEQCRGKLLNSISQEMTRCGFKILPPPKKGPTPSYAYPMYPLQKHNRKYKKRVHGDYFILLYACARITHLKANVLHKCVQLIEADLWRLEQRIKEFVESEMLHIHSDADELNKVIS